MNPNTYIYSDTKRKIDRIEFNILSNETVKKMSSLGRETQGVNVTELYDNMEPKRGGLLDPRMGTSDHGIDCETCGLNKKDCVGHFGHIDLMEPLYNFGFFTEIKKILGCVCLRCSKLLINKNEREIEEILKNKTRKARFEKIREIVDNVKYCQNPNGGCGTPVAKIKQEIKKTTGTITTYKEIEIKGVMMEDGTSRTKKIREVLTAEKCYNILKNISDTDCRMMGLEPEKTRPESMIYKSIPVPPVIIRPSNKQDMLSARDNENGLTIKLSDIVKMNNKYKKSREKERGIVKYSENELHLLQYYIASYFDNESMLPKSTGQNGAALQSLSSRIKGKEGRIRGTLMGKRVNFSGRTVITPDPALELNELGIPIKIAKNITYPEIVTPENIERMRGYVKNGRDKYPGANFVFLTSRRNTKDLISIDLRYRKETVELNYGDVVERHMLTGDYILLNRQPTLHKLSMMGHKARVIDNTELNTYRLNVSAVGPYNADFDGDEMNVFRPQSIQSELELRKIANVRNHIISPKDSYPIIGLIQDGLLGAYNLSDDNVKIPRNIALNLISYTTSDKFDEIEKKKEYTGKEIFSYILPKKINKKGKITIENGKLLKGKLTKSDLGDKNNSLIHLIWDEYGKKETKRFINDVQRLINNFNLHNGFTVGIGDTKISNKVKEEIEKYIESEKLKGKHIITEMENHSELLDEKMYENELKANMEVVLQSVNKIVMKNLDPYNNFNIMITSGSKGKPDNMGQMVGCIGQQSYEGKLAPKKVNKRSLPYFHQNDDTSLARGFIHGTFGEGLEPKQFVMHNMSAREGLIDTAIKTSDSGYAERKLIKSLEDIMVKYDGTVRSSNNNIVQYIYGDSGIDTVKQYDQKLETILMGNEEIRKKYVFNKNELEKYKNYSETDNEKYYRELIKLRDEMRESLIRISLNTINLNNKFKLPINFSRLLDNTQYDKKEKNDLTPEYIMKGINFILDNDNTPLMTMNKIDNFDMKRQDEIYAKKLLKYGLNEYFCPKLLIQKYKLDKKIFNTIIKTVVTNLNNNMAIPGEMVGCLAGQSIGEPITQLSCEKNTKIIINGKYKFKGTISKFIDDLMKKYKNNIIHEENDSKILNLDKGYKIYSVKDNEKAEWKDIIQVSRHPANGKLIRITTETGKTTTATLSHSFLKRTNKGIKPIRGSELKLNDRVPVANKIELVEENYYTLIKNKKIRLDKYIGQLCGSYLSQNKINEYFSLELKYNISIDSFTEWFRNNFINKQNKLIIPNFVFFSNKEFIKGILSSFSDHINIDKLENIDTDILKDLSLLYLIFGITTKLVNKGAKSDLVFYKSNKLKNVYIKTLEKEKYEQVIPEIYELISKYQYTNKKIYNKRELQKLKNKIKLNKQDEEIINNVLNNEIIWDKIVNIEILDDPKEYVYDFTVPGNDNFMVDEGIYVHNTLNSIDWKDKIIIKENNKIYIKKIGSYIDEYIIKNKNKVIRPNDNKKKEMGDTYYLDTSNNNIKTLSVNHKGTIKWNRVTALTKHLPLNKDGTRTLIKIKTKLGRKITATKAKSFLTKINDEIRPIRGDEIKIGTKIPVINYYPDEKYEVKYDILENYTNIEKLLAIYILYGKINDNINKVIISNKKNNKKIVKSFCEENELKWLNINDRLEIKSNVLARFMKENIGNKNKILTEKIYNCENQKIYKILKYIYKNCSYRKDDESELTLASASERTKFIFKNENIVDDLLLLQTKFSLIGIKRKEIRNKKIYYTISIANNELEKFLNDHTSNNKNNVYFDEITEIKQVEPSNTYVYDLTVENDKTFVTHSGICMYDTFHSAGIGAKGTANLGVPRINELFNASKNIKTPQMQIFMQDNISNNKEIAETISSTLKYLTFKDVIDNMEVIYDPFPDKNESIVNKDNMTKPFKEDNPNKFSCQSRINDLPWVIRIVNDKNAMMNNKITNLDIKSIFCKKWKNRYNKKKVQSKIKKILEKISKIAIMSNKENENESIIHIRFNMTEYEYIDIINFIDEYVEKINIKGLENINKVIAIEEKNNVYFNQDKNIINRKENIITTDGINLYDIRYINGINTKRIYCNDINKVYKYYGIEAARLVLYKELEDVYGESSINYQHLSLLVDIMTKNGMIVSIDRNGLKNRDTNVLSKISFEKPIDGLITSSMFSEVDNMKSVTSRIMSGMAIKGGTGYCDIIMDTNMLENTELNEDIEKKYILDYNEIDENNIISDTMNKEELNTFIP